MVDPGFSFTINYFIKSPGIWAHNVLEEDMARKRSKNSKENQVLTALLAAGRSGMRSEDLNNVCFRYSALIHDLRHKRGINIITKKRRGTKLVKFILLNPKAAVLEAAPEPSSAERVMAVLTKTKGAFITTAEIAEVLKLAPATVYASIKAIKKFAKLEESLRWSSKRGAKPVGYRICGVKKGGKQS